MGRRVLAPSFLLHGLARPSGCVLELPVSQEGGLQGAQAAVCCQEPLAGHRCHMYPEGHGAMSRCPLSWMTTGHL
eukprot:15430283-Alexandrium_andersonii.AAC.1